MAFTTGFLKLVSSPWEYGFICCPEVYIYTHFSRNMKGEAHVTFVQGGLLMVLQILCRSWKILETGGSGKGSPQWGRERTPFSDLNRYQCTGWVLAHPPQSIPCCWRRVTIVIKYPQHFKTSSCGISRTVVWVPVSHFRAGHFLGESLFWDFGVFISEGW